MTRIALAALAAAVTVIPCRMHAQDASYTQKRQQLVKELESTQSALQQLRGERLQLAARIENVLAQVMEQRAQQLLLSNEQSSLRQMDSLLTAAQDNLADQHGRLLALGDAVRQREGAVLVVLFRADSSTTQDAVQSAALRLDGADAATRTYTQTSRGALRLGAVDEVFRANVLPTAHTVVLALTVNGQPVTQSVNVNASGESVTYVQFALRNGQLVPTTWTSKGTTPF
jgi:septal ring factor EnvC (AmiA/AmiB activator)